MIRNKRGRFAAWFVVAATLVFTSIPAPARAQQAAASPAQRKAERQSAQSQIPASVRPDVQIVIMPYPTGKWGVTTVYPRQVPRAEAERRVKRLLQLTGWKATDMLWENRALQRADEVKDLPGAKDIAREPVMSSLTFQTEGNVVDLANGTMALEPFARAFRDLKRLHVTYLLAPTFSFRGLREHSDPNLDIRASGQQGAWTYVVNIKNHKLEALNLPRYDVVKPQGQVQRASAERLEALQRQRRLVGTSMVVVLAAAAGMFVWLWTRR